MDPVRTARVVVAASIEVALSDDVSWVETGNGLGGVETEQDVVMPGEAMGVEEQDCVRQAVVVFDYELEVGHGFVPLVRGDSKCSIRIVHGVHREVETCKLVVDP